MDTETWATIRRLHEVEKLSKSAVAKRLGIHRWTVRRALSSPAGPPADLPRRPQAAGKLEVHHDYLCSRLREYPELTGAKLLNELRRLGYSGGYTILKDYLKEIRPKTIKSFLRLETQPGEFAQVDWANVGSMVVGNAKRKVSCFVMVMSYSRMMYIEFTFSQCLEDFLAAHINAFRFFGGGIPKKINYDNLKAVVLARVGRDIRFNSRFMDFAGAYLFEPIPCGVRQAHEKGKVENGIKYVRSAFLAGRPMLSMSELNAEGRRWLDEECNVRIHGTTRERPIDRFEAERPLLEKLPAVPYDCAIIRSMSATRQSLVHFETNRYSVPFSFSGRTLTLKATGQTVMIYEGPNLVATHPRCYEKYRVIEEPAHYAGLVAARKKAAQTKRVESFLTLGPECETYLKGLVAAELHLPSHLDKLHELTRLYGREEILGALRHALAYNAFGAAYIQNIVLQRRAALKMRRPQPLVLTKKPEWMDVVVEETDLGLYDRLFDEKEQEK